MRILVALVACGFAPYVPLPAFAGGPLSHAWSAAYGDSVGDQFGFDVVVDSEGSVIVTGKFTGTIDFGGGPLVAVTGTEDAFLVKFTANGGHVWSKKFSGAGRQEGRSIAVDPDNNVIVTGAFEQIMDVDGHPLTSAGLYDFYVAVFDLDGAYVRAQRFGDSGHQFSTAVAADTDGEIVLTGSFQGTVDFGGGPLTSAGLNDICIARFDPLGNHIWSRRFGDATDQQAFGVAIDGNGNSTLIGQVFGSTNFGGGLLTSAGSGDVCAAAFTRLGAHRWSRLFGNAANQSGTAIACGAAGESVLCGQFFEVIDFGGGPLTSAGSQDVFIAVLDSLGGHIWSRSFGDQTVQSAAAVTVDPLGGVTMTGSFRGAIDFGGGALAASSALRDVYLARFGMSDGDHLFSDSYGDSLDEAAFSVAAGSSGEIVTTGWFEGAIDFGGGPLRQQLSHGLDIYVAKFQVVVTSVTGDASSRRRALVASPNPFGAGTAISYAVPTQGRVTVTLHDVRGRLVRRLVRAWEIAGRRVVSWDGRDTKGTLVAPGVYYIRLDGPGGMESRAVVLLR